MGLHTWNTDYRDKLLFCILSKNMGTNSISITKYKASDYETFYSVVKEDKLMQYISGKGLTEEEAKQKFNSVLEVNNEDRRMGYFKVYNSDGVFIGDGKLERCKKDRSKLEIGYILKEEFWGNGYGTMICTELLSLADKIAPTVDVIGIIDPDNIASRRLLEKFGFRSYFVGVEDNLPTEKLILARNNLKETEAT